MASQQSSQAMVPSRVTDTAFCVQEFKAGITSMLRSWSALRTAVEGQWGGIESEAKAEDLRSNIYSIFFAESDDGTVRILSKPSMDKDNIWENLETYMEEEFSVILEDGSGGQVANDIWAMYEGCLVKGDFSLARSAVIRGQKAGDAVSASGVVPVIQTEGELDDDDDDDETFDVEMMEEDDASKIKNAPTIVPSTSNQPYHQDVDGPLFGLGNSKPRKPDNRSPPRQLGEPEPEKPTQQVDDDGFAVVAPRRRRNH